MLMSAAKAISVAVASFNAQMSSFLGKQGAKFQLWTVFEIVSEI